VSGVRLVEPDGLIRSGWTFRIPMNRDPDPLQPLLSQWKAEPGDRSLAHDVWREIKRRETPSGTPGPLGRLETIFARPFLPVVFVLSCILAGLFLAEIRVARLQSARGTALAQSYLQLINPLLEESER
jgi:hypothetical protein